MHGPQNVEENLDLLFVSYIQSSSSSFTLWPRAETEQVWLLNIFLITFRDNKNSLPDRTSRYKKNAYNVHVLLTYLFASDPKISATLS